MGDGPPSRTTISDLGGPWHPGGRKTSERVNKTIAALLQQEFDRFRTPTLDNAIEFGADVHSEKSIDKYRRLVLRYGPFEQKGPGTWKIDTQSENYAGD
jgi:hypothetical protein